MPAVRVPVSAAFLLAQLGRLAADRFAERVAVLGLTPPEVGIMRAVWLDPGRSQQALSTQLALLPSRVVAFVDGLEGRGLVERRKNERDRRLYALHLTDEGETLMAEIAAVGKAHERDVTAGLTSEQKKTLVELLSLVAKNQGLAPGVHPGYRSLGRDGSQDTAAG